MADINDDEIKYQRSLRDLFVQSIGKADDDAVRLDSSMERVKGLGTQLRELLASDFDSGNVSSASSLTPALSKGEGGGAQGVARGEGRERSVPFVEKIPAAMLSQLPEFAGTTKNALKETVSAVRDMEARYHEAGDAGALDTALQAIVPAAEWLREHESSLTEGGAAQAGGVHPITAAGKPALNAAGGQQGKVGVSPEGNIVAGGSSGGMQESVSAGAPSISGGAAPTSAATQTPIEFKMPPAAAVNGNAREHMSSVANRETVPAASMNNKTAAADFASAVVPALAEKVKGLDLGKTGALNRSGAGESGMEKMSGIDIANGHAAETVPALSALQPAEQHAGAEHNMPETIPAAAMQAANAGSDFANAPMGEIAGREKNNPAQETKPAHAAGVQNALGELGKLRASLQNAHHPSNETGGAMPGFSPAHEAGMHLNNDDALKPPAHIASEHHQPKSGKLSRPATFPAHKLTDWKSGVGDNASKASLHPRHEVALNGANNKSTGHGGGNVGMNVSKTVPQMNIHNNGAKEAAPHDMAKGLAKVLQGAVGDFGLQS